MLSQKQSNYVIFVIFAALFLFPLLWRQAYAFGKTLDIINHVRIINGISEFWFYPCLFGVVTRVFMFLTGLQAYKLVFLVAMLGYMSGYWVLLHVAECRHNLKFWSKMILTSLTLSYFVTYRLLNENQYALMFGLLPFALTIYAIEKRASRWVVGGLLVLSGFGYPYWLVAGLIYVFIYAVEDRKSVTLFGVSAVVLFILVYQYRGAAIQDDLDMKSGPTYSAPAAYEPLLWALALYGLSKVRNEKFAMFATANMALMICLAFLAFTHILGTYYTTRYGIVLGPILFLWAADGLSLVQYMPLSFKILGILTLVSAIYFFTVIYWQMPVAISSNPNTGDPFVTSEFPNITRYAVLNTTYKDPGTVYAIIT